MNFINFILRHKILVVSLLMLLILGPYVLYLITIHGKTKVEFIIAPSNTTLDINGKQRKPGTYYLSPGDYSIQISREGFETYQDEIGVGEENIQVPVALVAITNEAVETARQDSDLYKRVEAISGILAQEEGGKLREKHPITARLPYRSLIYNIDYRFEDENQDNLILIITANEGLDTKLAVAQISNWGFDPEDFVIEYKQKTN